MILSKDKMSFVLHTFTFRHSCFTWYSCTKYKTRIALYFRSMLTSETLRSGSYFVAAFISFNFLTFHEKWCLVIFFNPNFSRKTCADKKMGPILCWKMCVEGLLILNRKFSSSWHFASFCWLKYTHCTYHLVTASFGNRSVCQVYNDS